MERTIPAAAPDQATGKPSSAASARNNAALPPEPPIAFIKPTSFALHCDVSHGGHYTRREANYCHGCRQNSRDAVVEPRRLP
jgi:hypothetical protein